MQSRLLTYRLSTSMMYYHILSRHWLDWLYRCIIESKRMSTLNSKAMQSSGWPVCIFTQISTHFMFTYLHSHTTNSSSAIEGNTQINTPFIFTYLHFDNAQSIISHRGKLMAPHTLVYPARDR